MVMKPEPRVCAVIEIFKFKFTCGSSSIVIHGFCWLPSHCLERKISFQFLIQIIFKASVIKTLVDTFDIL